MPTTATDFHAAYLALSGARHEKVCRLAGTSLRHPFFSEAVDPCYRRKCRRDGVCSGAMRPSAHLIAQLQLLQKHGLSSTRRTDLPACLADADDDLFAAYEASKAAFNNAPPQDPELFWPDFVLYFRQALREKRQLGTVEASISAESHV